MMNREGRVTFASVNKVSISADFVRNAIARLPLEQAVIDGHLHASKIPLSLLNEQQARVSLQQYAELITRLMVETNDELIGLGNEPIPLGAVSALSHWMLGADNMEQAIKRFAHFYHIMGKGFDLSVQQEDGYIFVEVGNSFHPRESDVYLYEFVLFCFHRLLCWLRKDIVPIEHLSFPFSRPQHHSDYRLMFYGASVSFRCDRARITFCDDFLSLPVVQTAAGLKQLLASPFTNLLVLNFYDESWSSRVGHLLQKRLPVLPALPELAEMLELPPYTLQRRLAEEGVTYLDIKNQVKRDQAIELLVHTDLSIEEISGRLGFSETSPFTRTFKQWTGVPPSAYRRRT